MKKDLRVTWQRTELPALDLSSWKVAVVGGTGGLGRALSLALASRGAQVTVVGQTFRDEGVKNLAFVRADLSSMRESERIGKALPAEQLDLVVFTTGIFAAPKRQETSEGLERDMAVSYLSRLVILREIAPRLGRARSSGKLAPRVFVMGYPGTGQAGTLGDLNADAKYHAMTVHMNTVAGNELLVIDAAKRYSNATFFGLHPGIVKTNIRDNFLGEGSVKSRVVETFIGWVTPSPQQYAARIAPLLVSPDLEGHSGAMFDQKGFAVLPSPELSDVGHVRAFLAESEALVARAQNVESAR